MQLFNEHRRTVVFVFTFISHCIVIFNVSAFAEDIYKFNRMWPTIEKEWYFDIPKDIASDNSGNIYIADWYNSRIAKFSASGDLITNWDIKLSGGGGGLPHGLAVSNDEHVYVLYWNYIEKYTINGAFVNTKAIGNSSDIVVDDKGNLYISFESENRIAKYDSDLNQIAEWGGEGSGDGEFNKCYGLAVKDQFLYVADRGNQRIQKFTLDGDFISEWGEYGYYEDGEFADPLNLTLDMDGNIYVADRGRRIIQKFTSEGKYITHWGGPSQMPGDLGYHTALTISSDRKSIYVSDTDHDRIQIFDLNGKLNAVWAANGSGEGKFRDPGGIAMDANQNIFVVDTGNNRIQVFRSDGSFLKQWGNHGSSPGQFKKPQGIAIDHAGNILIADSDNHRIQKFDSNGNFLTEWGSIGTSNIQFNYPTDIATDDFGDVYVIDYNNFRVQKFDNNGKFLNSFGKKGTGPGEFIGCCLGDIVVSGNGKVYISELDGGKIHIFNLEGDFIEDWDIGSVEGMALDESGFIYLATEYANEIIQYSPDDEMVTRFGKFGSEPGQLNGVKDLCVSKEGDAIYVADSDNHRIQVFLKEGEPEPVQVGVPKAIIVAGSGPYEGNTLWNAIKTCANQAFKALEYQGYTKESICLLSSGTEHDIDADGVVVDDELDGDATNSNLKTAITQWAVDADQLLIYMVGHGSSGKFQMGRNELLDSSIFTAWLQDAQASVGEVVIVYDACLSGSFIKDMTIPDGKRRVILTSADFDQDSLFVDNGTLSFSFILWSRLLHGDSLYRSFVHAKNSMEFTYNYRQTPLIDGNADGESNKYEDKEIVRNIKIGRQIRHADNPPIIGNAWVESSSSQSVQLGADDIVELGAIKRLWAVITHPDYVNNAPSIPTTDLPVVKLEPLQNGNYTASYDHLTSEGIYNVSFFAEDNMGNISLPKKTTFKIGDGEENTDSNQNIGDDNETTDSDQNIADDDSDSESCFIRSIF